MIVSAPGRQPAGQTKRDGLSNNLCRCVDRYLPSPCLSVYWNAWSRRSVSSVDRPTGRSFMVIWRRMPRPSMINNPLHSHKKRRWDEYSSARASTWEHDPHLEGRRRSLWRSGGLNPREEEFEFCRHHLAREGYWSMLERKKRSERFTTGDHFAPKWVNWESTDIATTRSTPQSSPLRNKRQTASLTFRIDVSEFLNAIGKGDDLSRTDKGTRSITTSSTAVLCPSQWHVQIQGIEEKDKIFAFEVVQTNLFKLAADHRWAFEQWCRFTNWTNTEWIDGERSSISYFALCYTVNLVVRGLADFHMGRLPPPWEVQHRPDLVSYTKRTNRRGTTRTLRWWITWPEHCNRTAYTNTNLK